MPIEQLVQIGGTAGLISLLLYIVKRLWDAHEKEDSKRDDREKENTALLRDLAQAVRQIAEKERTR